MKKLIILTSLAFVLMNCEVKVQPKTATAQNNLSGDNRLKEEDVYINNMHYKILRQVGKTQDRYQNQYYWSAGGVAVVNVTKDSLEVELLRAQLNSFRNKAK